MDGFRERLKDFQAFAERVSHVAEEKLSSVDGGTYREYLRYYSKGLSGDQDPFEAEEGQHVVSAEAYHHFQGLVQSLREASELLAGSVTQAGVPGRVLSDSTGAVKELALALERCLLYAGTGPDQLKADFWGALQAWEALSAEGGNAVVGPADHLEGLMYVYTDHGRCRAWVRQLLTMQHPSVEAALRAVWAHRAGAPQQPPRNEPAAPPADPPNLSEEHSSSAGPSTGGTTTPSESTREPAVHGGDPPLWLRGGWDRGGGAVLAALAALQQLRSLDTSLYIHMDDPALELRPLFPADPVVQEEANTAPVADEQSQSVADEEVSRGGLAATGALQGGLAGGGDMLEDHQGGFRRAKGGVAEGPTSEGAHRPLKRPRKRRRASCTPLLPPEEEPGHMRDRRHASRSSAGAVVLVLNPREPRRADAVVPDDGLEEAVDRFMHEEWLIRPPDPQQAQSLAQALNRHKDLYEQKQVRFRGERRRLVDEVLQSAREAMDQATLESPEVTVQRVLQQRAARLTRPDPERSGDGSREVSENSFENEPEPVSLLALVRQKTEEIRAQARENAARPTNGGAPGGAVANGRTADLLEDGPPLQWPWSPDHHGGLQRAMSNGGPSERPPSRLGQPPPPIPIALEVVQAEFKITPDAPGGAHVSYVVRATYPHPEAAASERQSSRGSWGRASQEEEDWDLVTLSSFVRDTGRLRQRVRTLSKRLTSLCVLHATMQAAFHEAKGAAQDSDSGSSDGGSAAVDLPAFPDPFELGHLEERALRTHLDKLAPNFKARGLLRQAEGRLSAYVRRLTEFLQQLQVERRWEASRLLCGVLWDFLGTCDQTGRVKLEQDLVVGLLLDDVAGGQLSPWEDDESQLRAQGGLCAGCSNEISSDLLGMRKDYWPCRYLNALFCRARCHSEGRRAVPYRAVHQWDLHQHRVCDAAARLLDSTHYLPVICVSALNPGLFETNQALRHMRSLRTQLYSLRRLILFPPESRCEEAYSLLKLHFGGRMHLAADTELYSMEDLMGVKDHTLADFLTEIIEHLSEHVADRCALCASKSSTCGLCDQGGRIYAFQIWSVTQCGTCKALFHKGCCRGQGDSFQCPRCVASRASPELNTEAKVIPADTGNSDTADSLGHDVYGGAVPGETWESAQRTMINPDLDIL